MIEFRKLTDDDYPLLLEWLQRPHIKQYWNDGDDTLEKVVSHYRLNDSKAKYFIAQRQGQNIGFYQYWHQEKSGFGVDMFLTNVEQLSQGLGAECLNAFCDHIINSEDCHWLSVDPHPSNKRAIRCYEKCGFEYVADLSNAQIYLMQRLFTR